MLIALLVAIAFFIAIFRKFIALRPCMDYHGSVHMRKEGTKYYICSSRLGLIRWYMTSVSSMSKQSITK